jgi:3-hydroxyisobutyrate dehydrogenase-like beta-hydroxyacid dehydrogenase
LSLPLLATVDERWEQAMAQGHADEDVASVVEVERASGRAETAGR